MNFGFKPVMAVRNGMRGLTLGSIRALEKRLKVLGVSCEPLNEAGLSLKELRSCQLQLRKRLDRAFDEKAGDKRSEDDDGGTPPSAAAPVTPVQPKPAPAPVKGLITATKVAPAPVAKVQPAASSTPAPGPQKPELCLITLASQTFGESTIKRLHATVGDAELEDRCRRLFVMDGLDHMIPGLDARPYLNAGFAPRKLFGAARAGHAEKIQKLRSALAEQGAALHPAI